MNEIHWDKNTQKNVPFTAHKCKSLHLLLFPIQRNSWTLCTHKYTVPLLLTLDTLLSGVHLIEIELTFLQVAIILCSSLAEVIMGMRHTLSKTSFCFWQQIKHIKFYPDASFLTAINQPGNFFPQHNLSSSNHLTLNSHLHILAHP